MKKHNTKSVKVLCGEDSCTLVIFEGTDSASLVHALTSRFRLGQLPFHLTYPGDDAVVPLTAAIPGGVSLTLQVDGGVHGMGACINSHSSSQEVQNATGELDWDGPAVAAAKLKSAAAKLNSTFECVLDTHVQLPSCEEEDKIQDHLAKRHAHSGELSLTTDAREPLLPSAKCFLTPQSSVQKDYLPPHAKDMSREHSPAVFSAVDDAMADVVRVVDRFSRLSSELANERTLLAWIRTAMSAIRGVFAFFAIASDDTNQLYLFCQMSFMATVIFGFVSGTLRYNRVRNALRLPDPPQDFGRVSIMWFNVMVFAISVCVAFGIFTRQWTKDNE